MNFSKRKYLEYISKNIAPHDREFMEGYVQMDGFSISQVQDVFETNIVPNKDYFDFCFYIEENFSDWKDGRSLGCDYLFFYMGSLFLYCSSKVEGGYSPDVTSLYVRGIIQILKKHNDIEGGRYFYDFLSSINASNDYVEYFLALGKLFVLRALLINLTDADTINNKIQLLIKSFNDLSFSFVTDSVECPNEWVRLNKDLPISEELQNIDFDKILLPVN